MGFKVDRIVVRFDSYKTLMPATQPSLQHLRQERRTNRDDALPALCTLFHWSPSNNMLSIEDKIPWFDCYNFAHDLSLPPKFWLLQEAISSLIHSIVSVRGRFNRWRVVPESGLSSAATSNSLVFSFWTFVLLFQYRPLPGTFSKFGILQLVETLQQQ
mmetsp:Transcript_1657/g.3172  ORF Transcript_1657/g.3172 Transcript_1657/m.3172 type:complete len:158 (-) Transcript_1657:275-748(-)